MIRPKNFLSLISVTVRTSSALRPETLKHDWKLSLRCSLCDCVNRMLTALLSTDYWGTDNQPPRSGARADAFCQMLSYGFQMKPERGPPIHLQSLKIRDINDTEASASHVSFKQWCYARSYVLYVAHSYHGALTHSNNDVVYKYWFHPEGENPGTGTLTSTRGHNTGEVMWGGLPRAAWAWQSLCFI